MRGSMTPRKVFVIATLTGVAWAMIGRKSRFVRKIPGLG